MLHIAFKYNDDNIQTEIYNKTFNLLRKFNLSDFDKINSIILFNKYLLEKSISFETLKYNLKKHNIILFNKYNCHYFNKHYYAYNDNFSLYEKLLINLIKYKNYKMIYIYFNNIYFNNNILKETIYSILHIMFLIIFNKNNLNKFIKYKKYIKYILYRKNIYYNIQHTYILDDKYLNKSYRKQLIEILYF